MQLIFEQSKPGRTGVTLPACDVPAAEVPASLRRKVPLGLPQVSQVDVTRHYTNLSRRAFGVDLGFYPLGSCTMKYNPKVNEDVAVLPGFTGLHPRQPLQSVQGALAAMWELEGYLREITGMDAVTLQPAAGAHGEFTALAMVKAYHTQRGDTNRTKILVPDSAHGTNPASAAMNGFATCAIPSAADGTVDLEALRARVGDDTAALMLTNPNTLGLFETQITQIAEIVHEAGGLLYYDGANLNAVMGLVRPGDTGFDLVHLNLHKTFSTPHGGGGPGSGPVGCKAALAPFLPGPVVSKEGEGYTLTEPEHSIGRVQANNGNFLVYLKALTYCKVLGREGIARAAKSAVLNANYLMENLRKCYSVPYEGPCMHEFVLSLEGTKKACGVSAADIAKGLIDKGIHPPTMYFPLIVPEALMLEPTETESRETLDAAIEAFCALMQTAKENPDALHNAPITTPVGRPDETAAVRNPILSHQ